jgi:hypothetical protein
VNLFGKRDLTPLGPALIVKAAHIKADRGCPILAFFARVGVMLPGHSSCCNTDQFRQHTPMSRVRIASARADRRRIRKRYVDGTSYFRD